MPRQKNPTNTHHIRVPQVLDAWINKSAVKDGRSYNGMVVRFLQLVFEAENKQTKEVKE